MQGTKVLIVEDESVVSLDIQTMLERLGYIVPGVVSRGEEVCAAVQQTNPDLVLMDIHLAGKMDGIEAANQLRQQHENLPVIFLTAFVDETVLQRASESGSFGYILKPFEERELVVNIKMALYKVQMEQTIRDREAYFRALIENSTDIISIIDTEGITRFVSPSVSRVLGYQPEVLIGQDAFMHVYTEDVPRSAADLRASIGGENELSATQFRFQHKNGTWRIMEVHASNQTDNPLIRGTIINARDITERAEMAKEMRYNVLHDPLTGLPNRTYFLEALSKAIDLSTNDHSHRFAVLFLDLDSFKLVNDSFGHTAGDKLLVATARRLEACVRSGDIVARLSGDEFFILLDNIRSPAQTIEIADTIMQELQKPLTIDGKTFHISCSIGIVLCNDRNQFVEDIIRDADIAMYQAKARGKAGYAFFVPDMRTQPATRLKLENDLRQAAQQGEFTLKYQPIFSLVDHSMYGFEALVRWNHPVQGEIQPLDFIPILEETGLIIPAGEWILNQACQQIHAWHMRYPSLPPLSISVNVSARQFMHTAFIDQVHQVLRHTGLKPSCLNLELTESVFLNDTNQARSVIFRLSNLGVGIHIDDFGTGYSSLSYLQSLPFSAIKIDRSFIQKIETDKNQQEIVKSILRIANITGAYTIAEGLETAQQLEQVQSMGCQFGQGFYISHPLGADAAEAFLHQNALCGSTQAAVRGAAQNGWLVPNDISQGCSYD